MVHVPQGPALSLAHGDVGLVHVLLAYHHNTCSTLSWTPGARADGWWWWPSSKTHSTTLANKGGPEKLEKKEKKKRKKKEREKASRQSRSAEGLAYKAYARPTKFLKEPQDTPLWPMWSSAEHTIDGASSISMSAVRMTG
jgi:hypothetical protein